MEAAARHVLVVANRTAATPLLIETVRKRAAEGPFTFALLIPNEPRKGGSRLGARDGAPASRARRRDTGGGDRG